MDKTRGDVALRHACGLCLPFNSVQRQPAALPETSTRIVEEAWTVPGRRDRGPGALGLAPVTEEVRKKRREVRFGQIKQHRSTFLDMIS